MRWLLRLLLFWAITAPLFYVFGLPYLLDMLSKKTQAEAYAQCQQQLLKEGLIGSKNSPINEQQGVGYCHCASDHLILTQNDVFDLVQKKPPAALTALSESISRKCNTDLQRMLGFLPPESTPATGAPAHGDGMVPL
jgi:hypothetical protein